MVSDLFQDNAIPKSELSVAIMPIVEDSRKERGCLQYQFSQAQDEPRRIMIWEEVSQSHW